MLKPVKFFWLVAVLLVFIPLYPKFPLANVGGGGVAVRLEDFVILAVVATWGFFELKNRFAIRNEPVFRSILLYLGIGFVSIFSAFVLTKSIDLKVGLLHAFRRVEYMAMFAVGFSFLKSSSQLKILARVIILVAVIVGLYGLGQQYWGWPVVTTNNSEFAKGLALRLGSGARINSTFAGHYDLAAYSALPLLLILGLLATKSKHRLIILACGVPIYWSSLLSASRVAFAAFFVAAFFLLISLRKYMWVIPLAALGVGSVLVSPQLSGRYRELIINHLKIVFAPVVYAAVDEEVADALKPAEAPEDRSLNIRLNVEWPRAMRALLRNPFLGSGFSSVGLATDNDYLRSMAETGLLGFVALGGVFYRIFRGLWSSLIRQPRDFPELFMVCSTYFLVGILLNAVFIDVLEASKIAVVTWLVLGLAYKARQLT